jgi:hypothetical protein
MYKKTIRADSIGRVCLGKFAKGVRIFCIRKDSKGRIILEPYKEVPIIDKKWNL